MCANEPFGIYGDGFAADLPALTPEGLWARYQDVLTDAAIELVTVGDMDARQLARIFTEKLTMPRGAVFEPISAADYKDGAKKERDCAEGMDIAQAKLCLGLRAGVPPTGQAYCDLLVANAVFGGGADSKLFKQVREKESLCYYVQSVLYRYKSILLVEAGVAPKDLDRAKALIQKQLAAMQAGDIGAEALDKAKKALVKHMSGLADSPSAIADFALSQALAGEAEAGLDDMAVRIAAVTEKSCVKAFADVALTMCYRLTPQEGGRGE